MYIASYFIGICSIIIGIYFFTDMLRIFKGKTSALSKDNKYLNPQNVYRCMMFESLANGIMLIICGIIMIIFCAAQIIFLEIILFAIITLVSSKIISKYN